MKYTQLISKCIQLIDSYNQDMMTPDSHAQQFISHLKCEDTQKVFLKQIFYGYQRYKFFLKTSNNIIFNTHTTMTNRKNDATLFAIFTYIICFRLDELPFAQFKKMIMTQEMIKMNVILTFIFNLQKLEQDVLPLWSKFLQMDYLETKLMPKLQQRKIKCQELIAKVNQLATNKKGDNIEIGTQHNLDITNRSKKVTIPQQFNLTKMKPKQLPEIEKIEINFKANPIPKNKKDLKSIQQQKLNRRKEIQENIKNHYQDNKQDFNFETSKRPTNLPKIKQEIQQIRIQEMNKKIIPRLMPKYNEVDVKLNIAAILREQNKLNKKIQQQEMKIRNFEINMRDQSEFELWKKDMKDKDKYDKLEQQQKRKIEMQLCRQAANKAYKQKIEQNKQLVIDMKEQAKQFKIERQKLQNQELINKKKIIQQVQQLRQNVIVQKEKIIKKNKKIHDYSKQENKRILQKKKQQQKIQMKKKKQLIIEIRELEQRIKIKPKQQIEHISQGYLQEFSLQQLQIRLIEIKQQRQQQQEKKRQINIKKKQEFKSTINQKKNHIMQQRQQLAKKKNQQRRKKKQQIELQKQKLNQVKIKSINEYKKKQEQKKLQKKKEKEKLAKEIKQTQQRRMFLMEGKAAQQALAFQNLEKGQERQILDRQNSKLRNEYKHQSIKEGQMKILANQNKKTVQKKIQFNCLYNEKQEEDNKMAQMVQQEDQANKAMKYQQIRQYKAKHNQNMTKMNPYKTKIAQMSLGKSNK